MSENKEEKKRYKIYVHIKPVVISGPNGQQIVMQTEENQIYKRWSLNEDEAKDILKTQLCEYYHNDWEIYQVEEDKTHKVQ